MPLRTMLIALRVAWVGLLIWTAALALPVFASLPVADSSAWQQLEFNNVPANDLHFSAEGLTITVNQSASPIIYPLVTPRQVARVRVGGHLSGLVNLTQTAQGQPRADDFALRLGLVIAGDRTLKPMQRMMAPSWVKTLFALAPADAGAGIDRIEFFVASQQRSLLGTQREHPLSDLLVENVVWLLDKPGRFSFSWQLPSAETVIAVWLASDGDDTDSHFRITITEIHLD